jgi:U3 small nucleolar RNA-associated protein 23
MILEPPSAATLDVKKRVSQIPLTRNFLVHHTSKTDEAALRPDESEQVKLSASVQQPELPRKKKKGPRGPNPLSVKKKKSAVSQPAQPNPKSDPTSIGFKRKREDDAPVDTSQASSSGHKRKRRKTKTGPSPKDDAP